jgi:hypothetical protein
MGTNVGVSSTQLTFEFNIRGITVTLPARAMLLIRKLQRNPK